MVWMTRDEDCKSYNSIFVAMILCQHLYGELRETQLPLLLFGFIVSGRPYKSALVATQLSSIFMSLCKLLYKYTN